MSERRFRLTGIGAFDAVFRDGQRHEGRYVQLVAAPTAAAEGRAGFIVSRKVLRRAIDRNRFKRLVRTMLRASRPGLVKVDLIVRVKRALRRDEIDAAAAEAGALLARIGKGSP